MVRKVAVTGGIACGKTSLCHIFRNLGAFVVSADQIIYQLLSKENPVAQQVIELLGEEVISDGKLDKERIANIVFTDRQKLKLLEELLHPHVRKETERAFTEATQEGYPLLVAEIPLLYEVGIEDLYDVVVAVVAEDPIAEKRYSKSDFADRKKRQLPNEEKGRRADYIITNNGTFEELQSEASSLYSKLVGETS